MFFSAPSMAKSISTRSAPSALGRRCSSREPTSSDLRRPGAPSPAPGRRCSTNRRRLTDAGPGRCRISATPPAPGRRRISAPPATSCHCPATPPAPDHRRSFLASLGGHRPRRGQIRAAAALGGSAVGHGGRIWPSHCRALLLHAHAPPGHRRLVGRRSRL
ncbi:hypothetical protein BS78_10G038200 [Paspalum vaginatum]|nr:hypothetical protein BS78_10G038200 [Paspalum vaginatum]